MKKLALVSLLGLSLSAFGTNANHFIGLSPASTAMGGTGVANFTNSLDALLKNPALLNAANLGKNVNGEVSFLYIRNSAAASAGNTSAGTLKESTAKSKFSPSLGAAYAYNENLAVGLGLLAFGGAIADHAGSPELNQLQTKNSLIRLVPAVAYRLNDTVAFGFSPYLSYGSLSVNHSNPPSSVGTPQTDRAPHASVGFGGQLSTVITPAAGLTFGLAYNFESNITYKEVMNLDAFGPAAANTALAALDDIKAQQPAELALGAGYEITPDFKVTADYRHIAWHQASAFAELGWQDQDVIALGTQYKMDAWKFRAGFNYAKSPIRDASGETGLTSIVNFQNHLVFAQSITTLNLAAFPAFTESHVTFGAGYDVTPTLHLDFDVMLALKKSVTRSGTGLNPLTGTLGAYTYTGEASQFAIGLGAVYTL